MSPQTRIVIIMTGQWTLILGLMVTLVVVKPHMWFMGQRLIGAVLVLAGIIIVITAFREHHRINRTAIVRVVPTPQAGAGLVTTGIYSVVRHPLYLAAILLTAGMALVHGGLGVGAIAASAVVLVNLKARFEETLLKASYPEYGAYAARVGRLLPRLFRPNPESS